MSLVVATFLLSACASGPSGNETTSVREAPGGVIIVDTIHATATISAIDPAKRKITLVSSDGKKTTYKAGPEVVNFDQLQVGNPVTVVLTEEIAVSIDRDGAAPSVTGATGVALAPVGAKPGGVVVDTTQVTAKVTAVDTKSRKVTFELPDGTSKTVKVDKKISLTSIMPGDTVTAQVTEGLAITVDKR
jgi:hypothetical protein